VRLRFLAPLVKAVTAHCGLLRGTEAVAIIEFAVTLPIMLVLAVGIFDFGGAFNLKQKLQATAREGARFASASPTNDLALGTPPSVTAIRDLVDSYLKTEGINDCGLATSPATPGAPLVWTYTASSGCPGGLSLTLTIDRGNNASFPPVSVGGVSIHVISTQVTIAYPYQWQFNRVVGLMAPGATYAGTSVITTTAVVPNMD
jgi:Flp pilus assembly protein TadG